MATVMFCQSELAVASFALINGSAIHHNSCFSKPSGTFLTLLTLNISGFWRTQRMHFKRTVIGSYKFVCLLLFVYFLDLCFNGDLS